MGRNKTKKQREKYIEKRIRRNIDNICCFHLCERFTYRLGKNEYVGYCKLYNKYLGTFAKQYYRKCDECLTWRVVL